MITSGGTEVVTPNGPVVHYFNCTTDSVLPIPANMAVFYNVKFNLCGDELDITTTGILDTGASKCILPIRFVRDQYKTRMIPCNNTPTVNGVGGATKVLGVFREHFTMGELKLNGIEFLVVDDDIPVLIGQNVLRHPMFESVTFSNKMVRFELKSGQQKHVKVIDKFQGVPFWRNSTNNSSL